MASPCCACTVSVFTGNHVEAAKQYKQHDNTDSQMKGLSPLVFSRTSCPVSSSVLSISVSGYQKAHVPLGRCLSVILTSSALFTIADSCSSDRRSDSPLASTSVQTENTHQSHFSEKEFRAAVILRAQQRREKIFTHSTTFRKKNAAK